MITILKAAGIPPFSIIAADPAEKKVTAVVSITDTGKIIYEALDRMTRANPALHILRTIAMPDHLHFEIWVSAETEMPLGSYIGAFKADCTKAYNEMIRNRGEKIAVFKSGFNDRIAFQPDSRATFFRYIADNPRRYLIRNLYPEYFGNRLDLYLGVERLHLYGNFLLLENPVKSAVKISRRIESTPDLDARTREWNETIRCGGALVSPFINGAEKRFRDRAINSGSPVILIQNYAYTERSKPHKMLFELCEKGQLLIISKGNRTTAPDLVSYPDAQEMNQLALAVARLQPGEAVLRRRE